MLNKTNTARVEGFLSGDPRLIQLHEVLAFEHPAPASTSIRHSHKSTLVPRHQDPRGPLQKHFLANSVHGLGELTEARSILTPTAHPLHIHHRQPTYHSHAHLAAHQLTSSFIYLSLLSLQRSARPQWTSLPASAKRAAVAGGASSNGMT